MVTCYLGIGSNLGDRQNNIRSAIKKIRALKKTEIIKISSLMESVPICGTPHQGKFLNAALKIRTNFTPVILLKKLKTIEKELGRQGALRYGPRTMDLDILFYGDKVINRKELKVPHPKLFEREFVIKPLLEIV